MASATRASAMAAGERSIPVVAFSYLSTPSPSLHLPPLFFRRPPWMGSSSLSSAPAPVATPIAGRANGWLRLWLCPWPHALPLHARCLINCLRVKIWKVLSLALDGTLPYPVCGHSPNVKKDIYGVLLGASVGDVIYTSSSQPHEHWNTLFLQQQNGVLITF